MIGKRRRVTAPLAAALCALLALVAVVAAGCGSGGETSATTGAEPAQTGASAPRSEGESTAPQTAEAGPRHHARSSQETSTHPGADARSPHHGAKAGSKPADSTAAPADSGQGKQAAAAGLGETDGVSPTVKRKLAKSCPKRVDEAGCEALVEGFVQGRGGKSTVVMSPQDCAAVMSTADCETLLRAQKEAAERSNSVDVQACLANPTPACEAVLRPLFEQQYAASHPGQ